MLELSLNHWKRQASNHLQDTYTVVDLHAHASAVKVASAAQGDHVPTYVRLDFQLQVQTRQNPVFVRRYRGVNNTPDHPPPGALTASEPFVNRSSGPTLSWSHNQAGCGSPWAAISPRSSGVLSLSHTLCAGVLVLGCSAVVPRVFSSIMDTQISPV